MVGCKLLAHTAVYHITINQNVYLKSIIYTIAIIILRYIVQERSGEKKNNALGIIIIFL